VIDSAFVINPGLFAGKLPYDTKKDFAPISLLATTPLVLVVHPSVAANSAQELVALAKAKPGEVTFASAGLGTAIHLAGEQFRQVAGVDINHIPYRGGGPSVIDLLAGKVNFTFSTIPSIHEHVRGGRVRALGVTGARSPHLPDVPGMAEAGLAGVDASPLFGMVAPAAVPPAIVSRLSETAARAVREGALNQRLLEIGYVPVGSNPAEFGTRIDAEVDKWTRIIQTANIKPT
jgi:tripartite-type tricarboxylate transporter receptor subunit TctC